MKRFKYLLLIVLFPLLGIAEDTFTYNGFRYLVTDADNDEVALISLCDEENWVEAAHYYGVSRFQNNTNGNTHNDMPKKLPCDRVECFTDGPFEKDAYISSINIPEYAEYNGKQYKIVELRSAYEYPFFSKFCTNVKLILNLDNFITADVLTIPKSIRTIGNDFLLDIKIEKFNLDNDNEYFKVIDDVLYSIDGSTLVKWPYKKELNSDVIFPKNLHTIGPGSFINCKFNSTKDLDYFPATVQRWDDYCFYGLIIKGEGFNEVQIPENLKSMGDTSIFFYQDTKELIGGTLMYKSRGTLHIPAGLEMIGSLHGFMLDGGVVVDESNPYYYVKDNFLIDRRSQKLCAVWGNMSSSSYKVVTIPDDIKIIGKGAIQRIDIQKLIINDNVEILEPYALSNYHLEQIQLPNSITEIPNGVFSHCCRLERIELPEDVKAIGDFAFYECEKLRTISLNSELESIGNYTFFGCKTLTDITFNNNLKKIGKFAFCGCRNLEKFDWHESLTIIDDCAFFGTGLREVIFPEAEITLGKDVFCETDYLNKISTGNTLQELSGEWFRVNLKGNSPNISSLNRRILSVTLGDNIKRITLPFYTTIRSSFYCYPDNPPIIESGNFDPGILEIYTKPELMDVYSDEWNIVDDGEYTFIKPFTAVGISNFENEDMKIGDCYDIHGRKVSSDYKGIVFMRTHNGIVKKHIRNCF